MLSVFNGFEDLVKSLYSSFYPELKISAARGKEITLTAEQLAKMRSVKGVSNLSLVIEEKALLQNGDYQSMIYLKGVDDNYATVTDVPSHVWKGNFNTGTADHPLLILGAGIENAVGVQSDRNLRPLVVYLPRKGEANLADPFKSLSSDTINTAGAFMIQQDFDNKYAITNLAFVKNMLGVGPDTYGAAEISLVPHSKVEQVEHNLQRLLGPTYLVQSRFEQNASLYSVMGIEKWIIYAILSLILIVAAFNMVGALTMLVLEKKQDISVLHALGADQSFIQKIFLTEGLLLAVIGGGVGMVLAYILGILQTHFHMIPLEGNTFMIDYFPVKMVPGDFLLVGLTVIIIALVASFLPARKAALQQMALRTE